MVYRKFCVMCRKVKDGFFAAFPLDENRCRLWVQRTGDLDLVYVPIEKLHQIRYVCGIHFKKKDFTKTGKFLKKRSVPSLHLPHNPLTDEQLQEFPLHVKSAVPSVASCSSATTFICGASSNQQSTVVLKDITISSLDNAVPSSAQQQEIHKNISRKALQVESCSTVTLSTVTPSTVTPSTSGGHQEPNFMVEDITTLSFENVAPSTSQQKQSSSVISQKGFTPLENKLLEELKATKTLLRTLKRNAKKLENLDSPVLNELLRMALRNHNRKPKGRRWSTSMKISCLSIFKRSPKTYRYLSNVLPVPSTKTLQEILKKMPLQPGINNQLLSYLKTTKRIKKSDKICCLLFDEMALKPRLIYNISQDKVEGYTDIGNNERTSELADHALVFMMQGLRSKYKQPIAFYLVKGTISSHNLANIILNVINAITDAGFTVLATVCDQGPTNMGALKILKSLSNNEDSNFFIMNKKEVYIIFDVPHLFKSIRNNFLNYGLIKFEENIGKWEHLELAEKKNRECMLYLSKITPTHVHPKYRARMRVKYAAQILSNTVSAVLKLIAMSENPNNKEIMQTATIVSQLDRLLDCTNGPSGPQDIKKGIRENVSKTSNHVELWTHYRKALESVEFFKPCGSTAKNARCIQGYITTLRSLRDIWLKLKSEGQQFLNLRQLNQDALENLFGVIRQHNPTDRNPTPSMFVAALKTSIISGLSSPHGKGFNCLKDDKKLLFDFHEIVFKGCPDSKSEEIDQDKENVASVSDECVFETCDDSVVISIPDDKVDGENDVLGAKQQAIAYIAGYIASVVIKKNQCLECRQAFIAENPDDTMHMYIKLREWWEEKKSLTYPTKKLCDYVTEAVNIFECEVLPYLHLPNLKSLTITFLMSNCNSTFLKCAHSDKIFAQINNIISIMLIRRQCKRINLSLLNDEQRVQDIVKKAEQGSR